MNKHYGETIHGQDYEIVVSHGRTFRCYDAPGLERFEVCVEDGVITHSQYLPDEMNQWQARAVAAMMMDAADALEREDARAITEAGRKALEDGRNG